MLWLLVSVLLVVFLTTKNYPRGFSRHGDYTIKESQVLEQYGQAFKALDSGERKPATKEEKEFVAFCRGERAPETFFEKPGINIVLALTQQNVFTPYQVM